MVHLQGKSAAANRNRVAPRDALQTGTFIAKATFAMNVALAIPLGPAHRFGIWGRQQPRAAAPGSSPIERRLLHTSTGPMEAPEGENHRKLRPLGLRERQNLVMKSTRSAAQ